MPRGDGTGPQGQGPMTGRGMGQCPEGKRPGRSKSNSLETPADIPKGRGNATGVGRNSAGRGLGRGQGNR